MIIFWLILCYIFIRCLSVYCLAIATLTQANLTDFQEALTVCTPYQVGDLSQKEVGQPEQPLIGWSFFNTLSWIFSFVGFNLEV